MGRTKTGLFEADTVAHCGTTTKGQYICTLTLTDVHSGWTENRALLNKAHRWVKEATEDVRIHLPFAMKGLDSDNGREFKIHSFCSGVKRNTLHSPEAGRTKRMTTVLLNRKTTAWYGVLSATIDLREKLLVLS